jgi:hypothetical protein
VGIDESTTYTSRPIIAPVRIRALKGTEVMRDTPALRELSIFMVFTGAMRIESSVGDLWSVFHAGHITTALEDAG